MKLALCGALALYGLMAIDAKAADCNPNDLREAAASFCSSQGGEIQNDERIIGRGNSWTGSLLTCVVGGRSRDVFVARASNCGVSQPCFYARGRCAR